MTKADIVRKACVKAYNLDFDQFQKLFPNLSFNDWRLMQDDFSRWFCRLDRENSEIFCEDLK